MWHFDFPVVVIRVKSSVSLESAAAIFLKFGVSSHINATTNSGDTDISPSPSKACDKVWLARTLLTSISMHRRRVPLNLHSSSFSVPCSRPHLSIRSFEIRLYTSKGRKVVQPVASLKAATVSGKAF